jgi:hypothetical protein
VLGQNGAKLAVKSHIRARQTPGIMCGHRL